MLFPRVRMTAMFAASCLAWSGSTGANQNNGVPSCLARASSIGSASVHWIPGPEPDLPALEHWCRAVGPPLYIPSPVVSTGTTSPPRLEDLVVVTWNVHLAEGRLLDFVEDLRAGRLTDGTPVDHFVLFLQELYRRGEIVPPFAAGARSAVGIRARDPTAPDIAAHARTLGLATLYVPSMRNGAESFEDRGNTILSTEPLSNAMSVELPLQRQRRVAVGAAVAVSRDGIWSTLRLINVHLEPVSSSRSLWVLRNPRRRQIGAVLDLLSAARFEDDVAWAGTVLAGDLNTIQSGAAEATYRQARAWGHSTGHEDGRSTHSMGRIDYVFYRLPTGWTGSTTRWNELYGSDHHPVLGRFIAGAGNKISR